MRDSKNLAIILVACLGFGVAACAQMVPMGWRLPPEIFGELNPVLGSGVQYAVTTKDGQKFDLVYVIVGDEIVNGRLAYWLETRKTGEWWNVLKQLIVISGNKRKPRVKRVIVQEFGHRPMAWPNFNAEDAEMTQDQTWGKAWIPASPRKVGMDTVTVPAGTFESEHYRGKTETGALADIWKSPRVTPYGLVKMTSKDETIILQKLLENETSQIKDEPKNTP